MFFAILGALTVVVFGTAAIPVGFIFGLLAIAEATAYMIYLLRHIKHSLEWLKLYHQRTLVEDHPKATEILQSIQKVLDPYYRPPAAQTHSQPATKPTAKRRNDDRPKTVFQTEVLPEYPDDTNGKFPPNRQ